MTRFLLRAAIAAFGLWLSTQIVPGIRFSGAGSLAGAAVLLGLVNAVVKPVALLLSLPLLVISLGLFYFVINAAMFALVASLLDGFHVEGFVAALLGSCVVSAVSWLGSAFSSD